MWVPAPTGGLISFVRPKEMNERKRRPTVTPYGFPAMLARSGGSGTRCRSDTRSLDPDRAVLLGVTDGVNRCINLLCSNLPLRDLYATVHSGHMVYTLFRRHS